MQLCFGAALMSVFRFSSRYVCCILYAIDLKDPCVMETAGCHVTLMNAINQSGLMDKYNHHQRFKVIQVTTMTTLH